ncbi:MAG: S8 family serine peptidase [Pseudomonadota bacterium]
MSGGKLFAALLILTLPLPAGAVPGVEDVPKSALESTTDEGLQTAGETEAAKWVVVLKDERSERRLGWSTGSAYSGSYNYADDPKLARLSRRIARDYDLTVTTEWPIRSLRVHCAVVTFRSDADTTLQALESDDRVEWVQPLNEFEGLSAAEPYRHLQGSLDMLNLEQIHERWSGAGVRIAMLDSGVEPDHPDIEHAITGGMDFVGEGTQAERHGTGIAGVLVANPDNGLGIAGVAPGIELHAYRSCWESEDGKTRCNSLTLSLALDHALEVKPHVVNLSLTGPKDRLLDALVRRLVASGSTVVAAWDERRKRERFPSLQPGVLFVGDGNQTMPDGASMLYAPGTAVLTAQPGHGYDFMGGSSLAAAHVSGVLALLIEAQPEMRPEAMRDTLHRSMTVGAAGSSIDACRALSLGGRSDVCRRINADGS